MRPRTVTLLALALLAAPLSGCFSAVGPNRAADAPGLPTFEFVDPIVGDHNHSDPALHALGTPTMELLAYHTLNPDGGDPIGQYGEADLVGDVLVVAVTGMGGETPGFVMLDVRDRAMPHVLSFTASPNTGRLADVKLHPDGKWLFAAAQSGTTLRAPAAGEAASNAAYWSSQNGLRLYDVSDPAAPTLTLTLPSHSGYGCHMVYVKEIAGEDWLFCVGRVIEVYAFDAAAGDLTFASAYAPQGAEGFENIPENDRSNPQGFATEARLSVTPHDITLQDDPVTGDPLMVVSWWDLGVRIVDVKDPTAPKEIGVWAGEGATTFEGNVHSAMVTTVAGKRVVVATPELLRNDPAAVWVIDAEDYGAMTTLGEWSLGHGADGIRFSTHNVQVANGRLYMAYYHAGVWVLDLAAVAEAGGAMSEDAAAAAVLGYYLPRADVKTWSPPEAVDVPDVWDVVVQDGYVYAVDIHTGLHVLHYLGDTLGDAAASGFA